MWEYICCHRARLGVVRPPGARWRLLTRCLSVPQHAKKPVNKQRAEAVSVRRRGANRGAPTRGLGYTGGIKRNQAVRARSGAAGCGIPALERQKSDILSLSAPFVALRRREAVRAHHK